MNEHGSQLEAALTDTFARRDREVGQVAGNVADVYRRAARRRAKRRTLTAVAAIAIVAAGIGGLVAVGQIDREGDARSSGPVGSSPEVGNAWFVCSGAVTREDGSTAYDWCELGSPYANPAWSCTGALPDAAIDGDDRPRFESCTAVGEAYAVDAGVCVAAVAPATTALGLPAESVPPSTWIAPSCQPQGAPITVQAQCVPPTLVPTTPAATAATTPAVTVPPMPTTTWVDFVCPMPMDPPPSVPVTSAPMLQSDGLVPATTAPCSDCPRLSPVEQITIVAEGQSIASIAADYGIAMEQLVNYNQWPDGLNHVLVVGEPVKIPPDALLADDLCLHIVVAGDSPDRVAEAYDTTVDDLRTLNGPENFPGRFVIDEVLLVPRSDRSC